MRLWDWLRSLFRRKREPGPEYNLVWSAHEARRWGRDGEPCRIVGKSRAPGIATVTFPDGQRFFVDRRELVPREGAR